MKFEDSLTSLAQKLRAMTLDPSAEVSYELMSGALVWSDERISGLNAEEIGCLRVVLHYRTSVILSEPDQRCHDLWDKLYAECPEWIGFSADRCRASETLVQFYKKRKSTSERHLRKVL